MREILFRGKWLDNGEWVEGNFYESGISGAYILQNVTRKTVNARTGDITMQDDLVPFEIDPDTVGQYTGLKDKNGKRIFEGDIILHDRTIWIGEKKSSREKQVRVVWFNRCQWEGKLIGGERCSWSMDTLWEGDTYEVVGNIYDNPELLGSGKSEGGHDNEEKH